MRRSTRIPSLPKIVKQIILPELEKEVNTGKNFANLRQIFNSIILSSWYKRNLKESLLNQVYADKSKVNGINLNDPAVKQQIYEQYLKAYKKGVFNYIKEDVNNAGENIPRKYFSGGMAEGAAGEPEITKDAAVLADALPAEGRLVDITTVADAAMTGSKKEPLYKLVGSYSAVIPFVEAHIIYPLVKLIMRRGFVVGVKESEEKGEIILKREASAIYSIQNGELPGFVKVQANIGANGFFNFMVLNNKFVLNTKGQIGKVTVYFEHENKRFSEKAGHGGKEIELLKGKIIRKVFPINHDGHREFDISNGEAITIRFAGQTMFLSNRDGGLFLQQPFVLGSSYFIVFDNFRGQTFQVGGHNADVVSFKDLSEKKPERQSEVFYQPLARGKSPQMIRKEIGQVILDKLAQGLYPVEVAHEIDYRVLVLESVLEPLIRTIGAIFYNDKELSVDEAINEIRKRPAKEGYVLYKGKEGFLILVDRAMTSAPQEINLRNILDLLGRGGVTKWKAVDLLENNALAANPLQQVYNITRQRVLESGAVFFDGHEIPQAVIKLLPDVLKALNSGHDVKIEVVKRGRYGKNAWPSELAAVATDEKLILNTPYSISGLLLLASINRDRSASDEISYILRHPEDNPLAARLRSEKDRIEQIYENGRQKYFDQTASKKLVNFFRRDRSGYLLGQDMRTTYIKAFFKHRKLTSSQSMLLDNIPKNYDKLVELAIDLTRKDFVKPQGSKDLFRALLSVHQFMMDNKTYHLRYNPPKRIDFIMNDLKEALESPVPVYFYGGFRLASEDKISVEPDKAMAVRNIPSAPGGIDLNTSNGMQWKVMKDGNGMEMNLDLSMIERFRQEGIESLSPVIIRMAAVTNTQLLAGLPKK